MYDDQKDRENRKAEEHTAIPLTGGDKEPESSAEAPMSEPAAPETPTEDPVTEAEAPETPAEEPVAESTGTETPAEGPIEEESAAPETPEENPAPEMTDGESVQEPAATEGQPSDVPTNSTGTPNTMPPYYHGQYGPAGYPGNQQPWRGYSSPYQQPYGTPSPNNGAGGNAQKQYPYGNNRPYYGNPGNYQGQAQNNQPYGTPGWNNGQPQNNQSYGAPNWNNGQAQNNQPYGTPGWNNGQPQSNQPYGTPNWNNGQPQNYQPYGTPGWNNSQPQNYQPYGTPGWNNGQPPYYQQNQRPPKAKGGLKVLWVLLISLAVVFVVAFGTYAVWEALGYAQDSTGTSESGVPTLPEDSSSLPSEDENVVPAPEGDVTAPDGSGIELQSIPATGELAAKDVYSKVAPSIVCLISTSDTGSGIGSGIILTSDGYIATNSHVVNDSKDTKVQVLLYGGEEYQGTIVGIDKVTDLAVIKIDAEGLTPAEFGDSSELVVGQDVVAIGSPSSIAYKSSMTRGIISGLDRTVSYSDENNMTYIQTDVAISPGNSGGALVNMYGQVVGITSSKISGVSYEGINFAIPSAKAQPILNQLMVNGYVENRPRLGVTCTSVTLQEQMYGVPAGVRIVSIDENSAFSGTDVQVNDIITQIDGRSFSGTSELYQILALYKPGDTVTVTMYRADEITNRGSNFDVQIVLLADNGETQKTIIIENGESGQAQD